MLLIHGYPALGQSDSPTHSTADDYLAWHHPLALELNCSGGKRRQVEGIKWSFIIKRAFLNVIYLLIIISKVLILK